MIFSDETNASTCVSLYIRQWDSKADLYGLVRGVRLRFHSVVKGQKISEENYFPKRCNKKYP